MLSSICHILMTSYGRTHYHVRLCLTHCENGLCLSHYDGHQGLGLSHCSLEVKDSIRFRCSSRVMLDYDIFSRIMVDFWHIATFLSVMSHRDVHKGLCWIMIFCNEFHLVMFIFAVLCRNGHSSMVMLVFLHLATFLKSYDLVRCYWKVIMNYDIHCGILQGLCWIVMFPNDYAALRCSSTLCNVKLLCSSMVISHCEVHKGLWHLVTFIKGYVSMLCSWIVMMHCDVHIGWLIWNWYVPN